MKRLTVRAVAKGAGIEPAEAERIMEEVRQAVSRWPLFARACGVRKATWERIAKGIVR